MEWPFKTVLPDGSVPPPTKIERINTFFENELYSDHRVRETTFGIRKQPSFVRTSTSAVAISPRSQTRRGGKVAKSVPAEVLRRADDSSVDHPTSATKAARLKQVHIQRKYYDKLPAIHRQKKQVAKGVPLFLPGAKCHPAPRQRADVQPIVYYCKISRKDQNQNEPEAPHRHESKPPRIYVGNTRKLDINKKIKDLSRSGQSQEDLDQDEELTLNVPATEIQSSSDVCLESFHKVREGKKKYNVFWSPALSQEIESPVVRTDVLTHARGDGTSRASPMKGFVFKGKMSEKSVESEGQLEISSTMETSKSLHENPAKTSVTKEGEEGERKGAKYLIGRKGEKKMKLYSKKKPKKGSPTPKLDLSVLDSDSDYNTDELGALDIVSSASDGTPPRGGTAVSDPVPEVLRAMSREHADLDEDFKGQVKRYVSDIIQQAYGRYERISKDDA